MAWVRTEEPEGGGTYRLWPDGGLPRYVKVGEVHMWDAFTFTAESIGRPGIRLAMHMRVVEGVPRCVEVRLTSSYPDQPVTGSVLNGVDLETWIDRACARATREVETTTEEVSPDSEGWTPTTEARNRAIDHSRREARRVRRARGSYSAETLRKVAEVYEANVDSFPTRAVREALGVAQSTAQLYVKKARERGFITSPAPKGGRP